MDIFQAVILGIVEGITEFLPVSSTGHLVVVSEWLNITHSTFLSSFSLAIQLGAILAAVVLYFRRLVREPKLWVRIALAFLPTGIVGILLYRLVKSFFDNTWIAVIAIFLGGIAMIIVELWLKKKNTQDNTSYTDTGEMMPTLRQSLFIGCYQVLAFIPGVSRSAATIIGGLVHKVPRKVAVEFSFLLAIPTMAAATGYDLLHTGFAFTQHEWLMLLVGGLVSFGIALVVMKWLIAYVEKYTFIGFGVYRIIFSLIFLVVFII